MMGISVPAVGSVVAVDPDTLRTTYRRQSYRSGGGVHVIRVESAATLVGVGVGVGVGVLVGVGVG